MSKLTRDLAVASALGVALLVSLMIARLLSTDPQPTTQQHDPTQNTAPVRATEPTLPVRAGPTSTPATSRTSSAPPTPHLAASVALSSGVQVVPRANSPRSYRPAPTTLPAAAPQPPAATPDPDVYDDAAALGEAWLTALCWYDYRSTPNENTDRAAAYGDVSMPPGQNPWTLDDRARATITAGHLGSGCTDIAARPTHTSHGGVDQDTITLTANQVLTADGTPYQAIPISLTRVLHRSPAGHWLIGPPVIAN